MAEAKSVQDFDLSLPNRRRSAREISDKRCDSLFAGDQCRDLLVRLFCKKLVRKRVHLVAQLFELVSQDVAEPDPIATIEEKIT